jgi:hypothetical protein
MRSNLGRSYLRSNLSIDLLKGMKLFNTKRLMMKCSEKERKRLPKILSVDHLIEEIHLLNNRLQIMKIWI